MATRLRRCSPACAASADSGQGLPYIGSVTSLWIGWLMRLRSLIMVLCAACLLLLTMSGYLTYFAARARKTSRAKVSAPAPRASHRACG